MEDAEFDPGYRDQERQDGYSKDFHILAGKIQFPYRPVFSRVKMGVLTVGRVGEEVYFGADQNLMYEKHHRS
jgi:hypothetical protein